jgi:hypothetical protein
MSNLPAYDDGLTEHYPRVFQPWGHGPIYMTRRYPEPITRGWCVQCVMWIGPDRTGDPEALRLVEDDACAHAHAKNANCGLCETCMPAVEALGAP